MRETGNDGTVNFEIYEKIWFYNMSESNLRLLKTRTQNFEHRNGDVSGLKSLNFFENGIQIFEGQTHDF